MDANIYIDIKFERQIPLKHHSEGQNIQDPTVLLQTPHPFLKTIT